jgi:hypothetical protein
LVLADPPHAAAARSVRGRMRLSFIWACLLVSVWLQDPRTGSWVKEVR